MKHVARDQHMFNPGPKRLLALDGGGVRGILTLGFLTRIEAILRARHGDDPDFRLCDYFDLIGGTSTGAIIAAGLALGKSVGELQALYRTLAGDVFVKPPWRLGIFDAKFPIEPLVDALTDMCGQETMGSDKIRTGLMIMLKRLDTGSPWMVHNNPRGKYYEGSDSAAANRDLLLRQVVRASTAVPHYFEPERLAIAPGVEGLFVDGGVGVAKNPALQLLMLATMQGYGLCWPPGPDDLLLVSVGTGRTPLALSHEKVEKRPALLMALESLFLVLDDTDILVQTLLQWLSSSPTAWVFDDEIGDLRGDLLAGRALLSYLRYNVVFEDAWLRQQLGVALSEDAIADLAAMDDPKNVALLDDLGILGGAKQVQPEHFPACFDMS